MKTKGVTLIELLVAITILVVVVTLSYESFRLGINNYRKHEKTNLLRQNMRVALFSMSRDIRCAYILQANDALRFTGSHTDSANTGNCKVNFVTCLPAISRGAGGYSAIEYYIDDTSAGNKGLVKIDKGIPVTGNAIETGKRFEIAPLVKKLELRYYDGNTWSQEWGYNDNFQARRLPKAVEITIKAAQDESGKDEETITTVVPVFAAI